MAHLEAMDDLKEYVGLNSYAQRDPVAIYRLESSDLFDAMTEDIREDTVRTLLAGSPRRNSAERREVAKPIIPSSDGTAVRRPVKAQTKIGRNDPCPCGSGKKYKKCCGANAN